MKCFSGQTRSRIFTGQKLVFVRCGSLEFDIFVIEDTLDPLTLGDVRNRAGDQYPLLGFERTETDFDWKNLDPPLRSR
jgi:hypothetical protein